MNDIVTNMDSQAQVTQLQSLMEQETKSIIDFEDALLDLPKEMQDLNRELLMESMKMCYDNLKENKKEIETIQIWVKKMRDELQQKILVKQDMELRNKAIYTYMHDIVGPEVIDLFDDNVE